LQDKEDTRIFSLLVIQQLFIWWEYPICVRVTSKIIKALDLWYVISFQSHHPIFDLENAANAHQTIATT